MSVKAGKILNRETVLALLRAAIEGGEYRFARQLALAWLAAFPGDLEITLLQAQSLIAEGKAGQVISALDLVLRKDPLCLDGYRLLARACQGRDAGRYSTAVTSLYVLSGSTVVNVSEKAELSEPVVTLEAWGQPLRSVVEALDGGRPAEAEAAIQGVFHLQPDLLLAAVLHLSIHSAGEEKLATDHLARIYHARWPDCLPVSLMLAEALLEQGNEPEAVHLLHQCAAADSAGQVARRLWGENHSYIALWPDDMVIYFDQMIPAAAASRLGWNILAQGEIQIAPMVEEPAVTEAAVEETGIEPSGLELADDAVEQAVLPVEEPLTSILPVSGDLLLQPDSDPVTPPDTDAIVETPAKAARQRLASVSSSRKPKQAANADVHAAQGELEKLAKQLKQPALGRTDGRYPVYVVFSCLSGLNEQYGPQTAAVLDGELRKLAGQVGQRSGWRALVYYPDDPACTSRFDLNPVTGRDPWKLKNALSDLDSALRKRGERIGALLIAGGDSVVPFHRLPNPTDDDDGEVASDSPYAALDANYFIPEWPVGRLPGEAGPDATLLLEQLRMLQHYHSRRARTPVILNLDFLAMFRNFFERFLPARPLPSFGYTAAVWRRSSLAVFRPIGAPHTVLASPPEQSGSFDPTRITGASLGYYNLHGLADSPSWYGQRDPQEAGTAPDYPVALSPSDLHRNGHSPRIIFSEACYGGHIIGKCEQESLALRFLAMGSLAIIGSTCISYGSIGTPLIAADLLGHLFWKHMKDGFPAGEALLQARVDLVREMERRQGYLDGEDQKTLISFVLYGDPLAAYDGFRVRSKLSARPKDHPMVKTVCDLPEDSTSEPMLSGEALRKVKEIVSEYLPGADLSALHLAHQHAACDGHSHHCPTSDLGRRKGARPNAASANGHVVVTASKLVRDALHTHHHYMRVTVDEKGKAVKLSISR